MNLYIFSIQSHNLDGRRGTIDDISTICLIPALFCTAFTESPKYSPAQSFVFPQPLQSHQSTVLPSLLSSHSLYRVTKVQSCPVFCLPTTFTESPKNSPVQSFVFPQPLQSHQSTVLSSLLSSHNLYRVTKVQSCPVFCLPTALTESPKYSPAQSFVFPQPLQSHQSTVLPSLLSSHSLYRVTKVQSCPVFCLPTAFTESPKQSCLVFCLPVAERNLKQYQFKAGLNVHDHIMLYRLGDYNPCFP